MHYCDANLPGLAANLALDEALLLDAEAGGPEVLRVWKWPVFAVIIGAGGRWAQEADAEACGRDGVPILRRSSGGGAVLLGAGCLCYSLVLRYERALELGDLHASYRYILNALGDAWRPLAPELVPAGISDLAVHGRKVAGSAQQRKRSCLLHHGVVLYAFDVERISRYLRHPPREPDYRRGRRHGEFVANLDADGTELTALLRTAWRADAPLDRLPHSLLEELLREKYDREDWHTRR
jgi:lipoate-protein ligase A